MLRLKLQQEKDAEIWEFVCFQAIRSTTNHLIALDQLSVGRIVI